VVSFIDKAHATTLIRQNPELGSEIGRRFAQDGQLLLQRMADLAYEGTEKRVTHVLLSLGEKHGVRDKNDLRIDLPLSTQDLAEMAGCSRQTASQELHRFTERGWIDIRQHTITLVNVEDLRRLG
jgi:CRP-like cAMP-binding protein